MLQINVDDIGRLERDLGRVSKQAIPYAERGTINGYAFETQTNARKLIGEEFVNRNSWTRRTVMVARAVGKEPARTGSTQDYMVTQEFGGVEKSGSIPTGASAGQRGRRPRTRLPRVANRMLNIQLKRRKRGGTSQRQRNAIAVRQAKAAGDRFVFLETRRSRAIYRFAGGGRLVMMHNMSRSSVRIPRKPWLRPSIPDKRRAEEIHFAALKFQMDRLKAFL